MYKLIRPFEYDKLYNDLNKRNVIKEICKDIKQLNLKYDNIHLEIKNINTGKIYSYIIINKN